MALKAVIDAVEARLASRWSSPEAIAARKAAGLPECPVIGINLVGDTPADGSPYIQVQYPVANVSQRGLSGDFYREDGAFRLLLHMERGASLEPGYQMADDLARLFRLRRFDGVQTYTPSSPVIDDRNEDGNYYGLSLAVPYEFDFVDTGGFYA